MQKEANMKRYLLEDHNQPSFYEEAASTVEDDKENANWKPAKYVSFETISLTTTKLNESVRPCGFRSNGRSRMIKSTCLLARIKKLNMLRKTTPKIAVCITMYNENESELKTTIQGVL